ncbi:MAG TPA: hypothetical protein DCM40_16590, partial [Maribacter sp.]|nr:hypothetical protein [Maribacter sp.]
IDTGVVEVDWQNRTKYEPFYSTNRLEYSTTVELCEGFVPGSQETDEECREVVDQAVAKGILDLTEFYNKMIPHSEEEQRALINNAQLEYYVDERPNSRVKLLIKIAATDFEKLENNLSFDQRVGSNFSHSIILKSSSIKEEAKIASSYLERLNKEAKIKNIAFAKLDLIGESRRLKKFSSKISRLFVNNGIVFRESHDDSIEIGFNKDFSIEYVLYNSRSMDIGFEAFRQTDPMNSPRTVGYVSNLNEMVREIQSRTGPVGLTEFLLKYTVPRPKIMPAGNNMQVPSRSAKLRQSQIVEQTIEANKPSNSDEIYFTSFEKAEQDLAFKDSDFVRQASLQAESDVSFVGDNLLSMLPEIIDRVDSVEGMFSEVLNKIDLGTLAGFAATPALGETPKAKSFVLGAIGVFVERITNINKKTVNVMKQQIELIYDRVVAVEEAFKLMQDFASIYGRNGFQAPSLPGLQTNRLQFAPVFGEYLTNTPGQINSLDEFIIGFQEQNNLYAGSLESISTGLAVISRNLDVFEINIQNFLDERETILRENVKDLTSSNIESLVSSLTNDFSKINDFYLSQIGEVFSDVPPAMVRNISKISNVLNLVTGYISGLDIPSVQSGIQRSSLSSDSLSGKSRLIQEVTDFPTNFVNTVSTQVSLIQEFVDSKIIELVGLEESTTSEVEVITSNMIGSIQDVDQVIKKFEIPSTEDLFQIPEIPNVITLPSLPDDLPTFDIMSYLVSQAENTILSLIQSSIIDVAKSTIKSSIEGISTGVSNSSTPSSLDYGGMDI